MSRPQIKHLRLINGAELIANVIKETKEHYILDQPLLIECDKAERQIYLLKYLPFAEEKACNLKKDHVVVCASTHADMTKHYFLSLKLNRNSDRETRKYIREINSMMESTMNTSYYLDMASAPSSNTVH